MKEHWYPMHTEWYSQGHHACNGIYHVSLIRNPPPPPLSCKCPPNCNLVTQSQLVIGTITPIVTAPSTSTCDWVCWMTSMDARKQKLHWTWSTTNPYGKEFRPGTPPFSTEKGAGEFPSRHSFLCSLPQQEKLPERDSWRQQLLTAVTIVDLF